MGSKVKKLFACAMAMLMTLSLLACTPGDDAANGSNPSADNGDTAGDGGVHLSMWHITTEPLATILDATLAEWNEKNPDATVEHLALPSDEFKVKIRTAIGAESAPNFIFSWGGGVCKSYADVGALVDLTPVLEEHPELADVQIPAILENVTFDGKVYGIPINYVQPAVFFYNKDVFEQVGAEPPTTWDELMALIPVFNEAGIPLISVAGQSQWTYLFYIGYLVDRVGGPEVFERIAANEPGAWSDPAVTTALEMIVDLVEAGGFQTGFESINADVNADSALVVNGKAGMVLQHGGKMGAIMKINPEWFEEGRLGYIEFPAVTGGKGDPDNLYGNTANYWSISAYASEEEIDASIRYLTEGMWTNDDYVQSFIDAGTVPAIKGVEEKIAQATGREADWMTFVSEITQQAPHFQMSWDNALSPNQSTALLTSLSQVIMQQMTPQEFVDAMNATIE